MRRRLERLLSTRRPRKSTWDIRKPIKRRRHRRHQRHSPVRTGLPSRFTLRVAKKKAMQVTANAGGRTPVVVSLARPTVQKRRSPNRDAHSNTECIPKKAAPPVFLVGRGELSEAEAIQRARHGDRTAFEHLYLLHSRRVYAVCLRMVGNSGEAEDLTQEAFLLLLRKIHTFRGESAFTTWLHRLAVNLVLMRL